MSLTLYNDLKNGTASISLVGLGYVGMPIAVAFAHDEFKALSLEDIKALYNSNLADEEKVLIDVKGLYPVKELEKSYWRL